MVRIPPLNFRCICPCALFQEPIPLTSPGDEPHEFAPCSPRFPAKDGNRKSDTETTPPTHQGLTVQGGYFKLRFVSGRILAAYIVEAHFQHILCHICIFWPHHFLANACFGTASSSLSSVGWNIAHIMTGLYCKKNGMESATGRGRNHRRDSLLQPYPNDLGPPGGVVFGTQLGVSALVHARGIHGL